MAECKQPLVSFENAVEREKTRQKHKKTGGHHTHLNDRMAMHLPLNEQVTMPDPPRDLSAKTAKREIVKHEAPPEIPEQQEQPQNVNEETLMEFPPVENYSMGEVYDMLNDVFPPKTIYCPFHQSICDHKMSAKGFRYVKCPAKPCPFFCAEGDGDDWSKLLTSQLYNNYKMQPTEDMTCNVPCVCYCEGEGYRDLRLGRSKSVKNHGRFYTTCKRPNSCRFFAWLNCPWNNKQFYAWTGEYRDDFYPEQREYCFEPRPKTYSCSRHTPYYNRPRSCGSYVRLKYLGHDMSHY